MEFGWERYHLHGFAWLRTGFICIVRWEIALASCTLSALCSGMCTMTIRAFLHECITMCALLKSTLLVHDDMTERVS